MARGFAFALRRRRSPQELPAALDPSVGLEVGPRFPVLAAFPHLEEGADGVGRERAAEEVALPFRAAVLVELPPHPRGETD